MSTTPISSNEHLQHKRKQVKPKYILFAVLFCMFCRVLWWQYQLHSFEATGQMMHVNYVQPSGVPGTPTSPSSQTMFITENAGQVFNLSMCGDQRELTGKYLHIHLWRGDTCDTVLSTTAVSNPGWKSSKDGLTVSAPTTTAALPMATPANTSASPNQVRLACGGQEEARLKDAPHPSSRPSQHLLQVGWASGIQTFKDVAPYGEGEEDGIRWTYCGFDPATDLHLIQKYDNGSLTGVMVVDDTGHTLSAGRQVLVAPNHLSYLAYEQPDGQDGETLKLYDMQGKLMWSGFDGLLSADGKAVEAEFRTVNWNSQNQLVAAFIDSAQHEQTRILTRDAAGKWNWISQ